MSDTSLPWQKVDGLVYLPAPDLLWRQTPGPLGACYNVLGVPLAFTTNAPAIAELAEEVFGDWGPPERPQAFPPVHLRVFLHETTGQVKQGVTPELLCRAQE